MWILLFMLVLFIGGVVVVAIASESTSGMDDLPFD